MHIPFYAACRSMTAPKGGYILVISSQAKGPDTQVTVLSNRPTEGFDREVQVAIWRKFPYRMNVRAASRLNTSSEIHIGKRRMRHPEFMYIQLDESKKRHERFCNALLKQDHHRRVVSRAMYVDELARQGDAPEVTQFGDVQGTWGCDILK
ncbi:hypothetical protein N7533_011230 [Penicillium manginii]|jgi:hypothetical protein|uniref:uncharacterized protein n=1 Tax=Penicillium manginii TaxID=203109 RepID=UPI0025470236|nr:uncharacterized protein N7533_011230 [Penicillium manginii]KAJ5741821.1 hypothetical protein N7533_011230 [Penicillium manginii]